MSNTNDLYEQVTNKIIADLETKELIWRAPWNHPLAVCMALHAGQSEDGPEDLRRRYTFARANAEQRIEEIERFFRQTKAVIVTGDRAGYSPGHDCIVIPPFECFDDAASYYGVLAHQLTHWTGGHASRLGRAFNSAAENAQSHAQEALVAELGACFLLAGLGLETLPRENHAASIQLCLKDLDNDKRFLFQAAGQARQAVEYINSLQPATSCTAKRNAPSKRPPG